MKFFLYLLISICTLPCFAQWNNNPSINTAIVNQNGADAFPVTVTDGNGGALVFFEKSGTDIYAQKINVDGTIAWGTANTPVVVCNATGGQYFIHAVADGSGGAFLVWSDYRHGSEAEIYVQHINSAGGALWTTNGVRITNTGSVDDLDPFVCTDGAGGVIIGWNYIAADNEQVFAQRIDAGGNPLWVANGVRVTTAAGFRWGRSIIPDGNNGAIIGFTDTRNDPNGASYTLYSNNDMVNTDVYGQRLSSTGSRLWGDDAVPVCMAAGNQENFYFTAVVSDGSTGAVFMFDDGRNELPLGSYTNMDIFAQRLTDAGAPVWALNGMPVTTAPGSQYFSEMLTDGANGHVPVWFDENTETIFSQRLNGTGTPQWTLNGVQVSTGTSTYYDEPTIKADGNGNYIYVFSSIANNRLEAQQLNGLGAKQWFASGITVCNAVSAMPREQKMVLSDNGSVIVAWEDLRNNPTSGRNLYGAKILSSGALAGDYITVANGNWNSPSTWQGGLVPGASSVVKIRHAVTVTGNASAFSILVEQPGGNLVVNTGVTLTITH